MNWAEKRRIPVLLAAATLVPIGVLSWLGWRVLQQDTEVESQRSVERLEVAAGKVAIEAEHRLQEIEERLAQGGGIRFEPLPEEPPDSLFTEAEHEEFQGHDLAAVAAAYRRLAESPELAIRAAALGRLGRVLRRNGDRAGALRSYADLERLGPVPLWGQPSGLRARQGQGRMLEDAGDIEGLRRHAEELARTLDSGVWQIDSKTYEAARRDQAQPWGAPPPSAEDLARVEAATEMRRDWRAGRLTRGRRILHEEAGPTLAVWVGGPERPAVWLGTETDMKALVSANTSTLAVTLYDLDGQILIGSPRANSVSPAPGETRLPFVLRVASTVGPSSNPGRAILIGGLLAAFALMLAAGYGLYRATTRELALARQESDFVSAVSHEFRTPLTSMRHLMDLLVSRGVASEERRSQYYELLMHETERLHRMVESLLSFGRIEAGAYDWRLEPASVEELLRGVVDEFRREQAVRERQIVCEIADGLPSVRADRDALTRALWNLLENACKYSEAGAPIRVFARRVGDSVLLGVEDFGPGIPPSERERIFQKFVRGAEAKQSGIRGVGIGLTLVKRIAEAHGGSVQLESAPGCGSTFTVVLPGFDPSVT